MSLYFSLGWDTSTYIQTIHNFATILNKYIIIIMMDT